MGTHQSTGLLAKPGERVSLLCCADFAFILPSQQFFTTNLFGCVAFFIQNYVHAWRYSSQ